MRYVASATTTLSWGVAAKAERGITNIVRRETPGAG
jgi:hypothetical protein